MMMKQAVLGLRFAVAALAFGASGCSTLKNMAGDFEKRWEEDPHAILQEMSANQPLSEERKAALQEKLAEMSAKQDCGDVRGSAQEILAFDGGNIEARLAVAECDLIARDLAAAKERFSSVADETNDMRARRGLGVVAALEGRTEESRALLMDVVAVNGADWRAWNTIGYIEDVEKNWAAAETAYRNAADADPDSGAPLNNLGMSYLQQKKYDAAVDAFKEALMRDPSLEPARLNMRVARALQGDYANALAGASERERAVVLNNIGVAALARGEYEVAKKYFRQALSEDPTFYTVAYDNLERARQLSAK